MGIEIMLMKNNFLKCVLNLMLENTDVEIWKEIQGFEGLYEVSTKGRVRNLRTGRILGGGYGNHGYRFVNLKGKNYMVHRLVALAFIPNPNNLPQVNHIDERKDNNDVSNLEWCTASYNTNYSSHKCSCKIKQLTKDSELVKTWESSWQIERETGYDQGYIITCCKGKRRSAYGYCWQYANTESQRVINRPVIVHKGDEYIGTFTSARKASEALGLKYRSINCVLQGRLKSNKGYTFKYAE